MACRTDDVASMVAQLPGTSTTNRDRYTRLEVGARTFGYLWEPTQTTGLKQTLSEQQALVAERPEVFEVQFTAGGFGWVVVHLAGIDRVELAELVFEAWRLTAPAAMVAERADRLPT